MAQDSVSLKRSLDPELATSPVTTTATTTADSLPSPKTNGNSSDSSDHSPLKKAKTEGSTETAVSPRKRQDSTELSPDQLAALERAKEYARTLQEELVRAGTISAVSDPEPSLSALNLVEQQKAMHVLCRVYVGSISFEATEQDVRDRLGKFGAIKELMLKIDPIIGKHRGFCFVEYEVPEAAILAVQATESVEVGGRPIKIGRPKNYDATAIDDLPPPPENRIYVANIGTLVSEADLAGIFMAFGKVEKCILIPDPITRQHRGFGYIEFKDGTDVNTLVASMKGFMLLDLPMGVCKSLTGGPLPEGMKALENIPAIPASIAAAAAAGGAGVPGRVANMPSLAVSPAMIAKANATAASTAQRLVAGFQSNLQNGIDPGSVESEENMSIRGNQRYLVMQSLARSTGDMTMIHGASGTGASSHGQQGSASAAAGSTVVRMSYDAVPADIDDQLEEEFAEECAKYGKVVSVKVLPLPVPGPLRIFIEFGTPAEANFAASQLNGRQFDGKTVVANLYDQREFAAQRYA